jgi:sarcosine oxidase
LARNVVVAAGVYTPGLVERMIDLPITSIAVAVLEAEVSDATAAALQDMPAMIHRTSGDDTVDVYAVPPTLYPDGRRRLKVGVETLPETPLMGGAEMRRWMVGDAPGWRNHLGEALGRLLPDVAFVGTRVKPCMYARTATGYPIVDHVAEGVVVAAGGNGRAAKSADAIGELATGLALTRSWSDPLPHAFFAAPQGSRWSGPGR